MTAVEIQRVESYLAIKYGITLDQTAATDYLASDGATIMWDATAAGTYNNDIAGIGRDDAQALEQRVSKSVNTDALVAFALDNDFTTANNDATRTTAHGADLSFMTWANNDAGITAWTATGAPTDREILSRVWKTDETGTVGTVYLSIPDNSSTATTTLPTETNLVYLLTRTTDDDFSSATGTTEIILTQNGTNWELPAGIDLADATFFTFATFAGASPGGVVDNLGLWLKADVEVTNTGDNTSATLWADQSGNANDANTVTGNPIYLNSSVNFNPAIDFDGSSQIGRTNGFSSSEYFIVFNPNTAVTTATATTAPFGWETDFGTVQLLSLIHI